MSIRSIRGLILAVTLLALLIATTGQRRPYTPPREPPNPPTRTLMPQQPQAQQMPRTPSSTTPQRPPAAPISPVTNLPDSIPVTPPTILTKDKLTFPPRPGVPANVPQTRTICGDPKMSGPYALRIKIPSGIVPMPHVHPDTRMNVVLEGVYYFGYGEEIDEENVLELQPGSFFTEPSNIPHYGWAKPGTTVIIQSTGYGPTATAIVPRKDNSPPDKKR